MQLGATDAFASIDEADRARPVPHQRPGRRRAPSSPSASSPASTSARPSARSARAARWWSPASSQARPRSVSRSACSSWPCSRSGSRARCTGRSPASDIPRLLELYHAGQLKLDELITRRYPLDHQRGLRRHARRPQHPRRRGWGGGGGGGWSSSSRFDGGVIHVRCYLPEGVPRGDHRTADNLLPGRRHRPAPLGGRDRPVDRGHRRPGPRVPGAPARRPRTSPSAASAPVSCSTRRTPSCTRRTASSGPSGLSRCATSTSSSATAGWSRSSAAPTAPHGERPARPGTPESAPADPAEAVTSLRKAAERCETRCRPTSWRAASTASAATTA